MYVPQFVLCILNLTYNQKHRSYIIDLTALLYVEAGIVHLCTKSAELCAASFSSCFQLEVVWISYLHVSKTVISDTCPSLQNGSVTAATDVCIYDYY